MNKWLEVTYNSKRILTLDIDYNPINVDMIHLKQSNLETHFRKLKNTVLKIKKNNNNMVG